MFCNVCGAQIPDGTAVCNFCGSPTNNYAAQGQGMYQQQPQMMNQMQPDPYAQMQSQVQPDPYAQMQSQMQPDPYAQMQSPAQPDPYAQMQAQAPAQNQMYGGAGTYSPVRPGAKSKPAAKINLLGLIGYVLMIICMCLPYASYSGYNMKGKKMLYFDSLLGFNNFSGKLKFSISTGSLFVLALVAVGLVCCIIKNNLVVLIVGAETLLITFISLIRDFNKKKGMYGAMGLKRGFGLWGILICAILVVVAGILPMLSKPANNQPRQNNMMQGNRMQNNMYY